MAYDMEFEIKQQIGILNEKSSGWKKELNMVSWKGNAVKLDIRDWNEDHTRCGKGITFTNEEAIILRDLLNQIEF